MEEDIYTAYSRGKLMLAGEYMVLAGSKSLSVPLNFGQKLTISYNADGPHEVLWKTFEGESQPIEFNFPIEDIDQQRYKPEGERGYLLRLLRSARKINKEFLSEKGLYVAESVLDSGLKPGFGQSSSLISNIAYWANVDVYRLNRLMSKGSGYDLATARVESAITYLKKCPEPDIEQVIIAPEIIDTLFLIHLNKKENSEKSISLYLKLLMTKKKAVASMNAIIDKMVVAKSVSEYGKLMEEHDKLLSGVLRRKTVKDLYFRDFKGWMKSSGAWGGDYILALTGEDEKSVKAYFTEKGFKQVIKLNELMV
ncbi:GYDIA family GHMP kinase [Saccharicrinis sp. FJH62]|uniref:GYDIA family GHMP kinase n=1 Tax=Saccharicrinis sp. FJH62 TaxID=3344657 RepID=UPI0035D48609